MSALLQHDNLDDRREIYTLLERLPPATRLAWIEWCCATVPKRKYREMKVQATRATCALAELARIDDSADHRLTVHCYTDVFYLAAQYQLDLDLAFKRLVELARRKRVRV